ncbi:pyridoxamine 5'-phosphate oxidase family protein [Sphaerisporangium dianthi]|uniref:Pyridoxamine 5'-phosphate oxidase family protein n=1 Tax=Sphaerisporangium dianthi TaxID=1436120 RepID=A0ABV9CTP0_9ACTN
MNDRVAPPSLEELDLEECLRLIAPGGVGRVGFTAGGGPVILPVNYTLYEKSVLFRTALGGPLDEDLSTGVAGVELKVAFEVDDFDVAARVGWSVLIQGAAHRVSSDDELAAVRGAAVEPWAGDERRLYVRINPVQITGRRIRRS